MLLVETKDRYTELLETIITNYSYEYDSDECNDLFEACFNLSAFICQAESNEYITEHSLRSVTALYVTKSISELIDRLALNVEHDVDAVLDIARNPSSRMNKAFSITQKYFESDGLFEMLGTTVFYTNFKKLSDQL